MKRGSTVDDWVHMYRQGITGAGITRMLPDVDALEVLGALAAAKAEDGSLEAEHAHNLTRRPAEDATAAERLTPSWRARLYELDAFFKTNGRMPRQVGGDAQECRIGRWLHTQRGKVTKGTLWPQQRAALDTVGNWDSSHRDKREGSKFPARLRALVAFKTQHGRWPSYLNRADSKERALGLWLHTARHAASEGRLPNAARHALDKEAPGWNPWQGR